MFSVWHSIPFEVNGDLYKKINDVLLHTETRSMLEFVHDFCCIIELKQLNKIYIFYVPNSFKSDKDVCLMCCFDFGFSDSWKEA